MNLGKKYRGIALNLLLGFLILGWNVPAKAQSTDTIAPSIPNYLTAIALSSSQVYMAWQASTDNVGIIGYNIYRNGNKAGSTQNLWYTDTGLSPNTAYAYTVTAYDAAGNESAQTTVVNTSTHNITTVPSGGIIPSNRMISWNAGIPGGIPMFPLSGGKVINVKTSYGAMGDGITDDTTAIQNAINAANPGDIIYLPASSYVISGTLFVNKGIVLKGDGVSSKILISGAGIGIQMGSQYTAAGTAVALSGSYAQGAAQITMAQSAGMTPGEFVVVDELSPSPVDTFDGSYLCEDRSGGNYSSGQRCIAQIDQVSSVNGPVVTLKDPLSFNYDSSLSPRVYPVWLVPNVGLEDLYIERSDNVGDGTSTIVSMFECADCFVQGVETHLGKGDHFNLNYTYDSVVRDSFLYMGHNDYGPDDGFTSFGVDGGESYGINFHGFGYDSGRNYGIHLAYGPNSSDLVENNIVDSTRHGLIIEGPGNGNVIAYNYVVNGIVYNGLDWVTEDFANHGAYPYMNLWEGNYTDGRLSFDYTHGNGGYNTIFRNDITSGPSWKTGGNWAIDLQQEQDYVNVAGNVLGYAGMVNESLLTVNNRGSIYRFGHSADGDGTISDTSVAATVLLHGNFDYISNSTMWDPDISAHHLPASLYLSSKPSWFGNLSWPPFGPDPNNPNTILTGTIPAMQCYQSENVANGGIFNPNTCYYHSSSSNGSVNYGDVNGAVDSNGNPVVTKADAKLVAQAAVGLITLTPTQMQAAEVFSASEAKPTVYDAYLIAQYAAGLITKFPAQP